MSSNQSQPFNQTLYGTPVENKATESSTKNKALGNNNSPIGESYPYIQKLSENIQRHRQHLYSNMNIALETPVRNQIGNEEAIPSSLPIHLSTNFEPVHIESEVPIGANYYSYPEYNTNLINPNQFIVPPNLPIFGIGTNPNQEIEYFTRIFALTLNAYGLNIDTAWCRLLPLCIPIDMQDWLQRTHPTTHDWKKVCFSLHRQYGNPNKRREALVKLYSCKFQNDESIMEFIQKFLTLMREAQVSSENIDMVDYLLQQLPMNIAIQLESNIQFGRIKRSVIEIEALTRTFPGVFIKRKSNNTISSNSINNNNNNNNNNNRRLNTITKYCKTHSHGNHTSEECYYPKHVKNNNNINNNNSYRNNNNINNKSYQNNNNINNNNNYRNNNDINNNNNYRNNNNTNNNNSYRNNKNINSNNNQPSNKNDTESKPVVCYYCQEPGHVSTYCPEKEEHVKSRRTWVRENDTKLNNNDLEEYEIPIIINDQPITALVDTGANTTFITQNLVDQLNILVNPIEGFIELAIPGFKVPRIAITDPVILQCGEIRIKTQLEVVKQLNGPEIFIGTDIISKLEIPINGLPFKLDHDISEESHLDQIDPTVEISDDSQDITKEMLNTAMNEIQSELNNNENISPLEICPLPMAVVRLDTPKGKHTYKRQYQIAEKIKPAMQEVIDEWIAERVITRMKEPTQFNTPIFPIPKKDHTGEKTLCRPCMDFRALNDLIISDKYPLPLIHDIFESLKGSKYFTSLDLKSAYHRFPVIEEHQYKTAFTWNDIQYKFLRAPFGLKNLPSQFQHVIHFIFKECPFVKTFIDDAIVFSPDWETHIKHVKIAIIKLNEARLILNIQKCYFFQTSLLLLGFRINAYGHSIDPNHIKKASNWPIPTTGKQIQAFLGFVNYFREHILLISNLMAPLDSLRFTKKIIPSEWTKDHKESFETLKEILLTAPLLAYPDFSKPFFIATDASNVGIGAVIYQYDNEHNSKKYISFQARALTKSERNYSATKRELLGIVFALKKFHKYVWGTHFTLYTDHKALTYLHTQPNLSPMLINWYELIFDYNFAVFYKPGIRNVLPDALSRFFTEEENETASQSTITIRKISKYEKTEFNEQEKLQILLKEHLLGHFGPDTMVKSLKEKEIFWNNILNDATKLTKSCIQCLRYNIVRHGYHPLTPIVADQPFDHIAIDLAGPFNTSIDKQHWLLIIIDIHSRFVLLRTIIDKSAASVADTLLKVFFDFGFPRIIQSDNGTEFVNHVIKKIIESARIDHRLITPYHPRSNGAAERTVQTAKLLIYKLMKGIKQDWSLYVPFTQYCINNKIKHRTKTAPFTIMFGRLSNPLKDYTKQESSIADEKQMHKHALFMQHTLFPAIHEATEYVTTVMKQRFDDKHKIVDYLTDTYVMIIDKIQASKSDLAHEGPFKIIRKTQGGSYELADLDGSILKRRYPPRDLIPISNNDIFQEESYEIDSIIDHRYNPNNEIEYKVKWKGYSSDNDSWEPFANFNSITLIDKYWNQLQLKNPSVVSTGRK